MGRSIEQVRRYLREGKLAGRRIGQQWFIPESALSPKSELDRWLDEAEAHVLKMPKLPDVTEMILRDRDEH